MNKKDLPRRDFIKGVAMIAGGATVLGLQGCGLDPEELASLATPAQTPSADKPLVGIARHDSAEEAVRQAIALTAGFGFIKPGDTVLLKPKVPSGEARMKYSSKPKPEGAKSVMLRCLQRR